MSYDVDPEPVAEEPKPKPKKKPAYLEEFEPKFVDTSIGTLLDFYIQYFRKHFADKRAQAEPSHLFRASTFGRCPRRALLQRAGVPELREPDKVAWRRFQWGDDIEWFTVRRLEAMGILLDTQVHIEDEEIELSTHIDAVVGGLVLPITATEVTMSEEAGENPEWISFRVQVREALRELYPDALPVIGLEIKSAPSHSMRRWYKSGPRPDYMLQVAAQAVLAERHPEAFQIPPDVWQILHVGKDAVGFLEYEVTEDWTNKALSILEKLREAWHGGTMPACSCGLGKNLQWEINLCAYNQNPPGTDGLCCQDWLIETYEERRAAT
jgi:hypothetical protein